MLKALKNLINLIEYDRCYRLYRIFPFIFGGLVALGGWLFGIIDAAAEVTKLGEWLGFAAFIIWGNVGSLAAPLVFALSVILISPTVVRTDAIIEIRKTLKPSEEILEPFEETLESSEEPVEEYKVAVDDLPDEEKDGIQG